MKHERSDIRLLLGLLLIFSTIIGVLHAQQKSAQSAKTRSLDASTESSKKVSLGSPIVGPVPPIVSQGSPNDQSEKELGIASLSQEQLLQRILPFIQSQSIENIVAALRDVPVQIAVDLITSLIEKSLLGRDDTVLVIGGMSTYYPAAVDLNTLFSLMLRKAMLQKGRPPLFIMADSIYAPKAVPAFLSWVQGQRVVKNSPLKNSYNNALKQAIKEHSVKVLKNLDAYGKKLSPAQASELLWLAAVDERNLESINFLLKHGADVNYAYKGLTPLMRAATSNKLPVVVALVGAGADVNKIVQDDVGSALQLLVSLEQSQAEGGKQPNTIKNVTLLKIEDYLRAHGAHE